MTIINKSLLQVLSKSCCLYCLCLVFDIEVAESVSVKDNSMKSNSTVRAILPEKWIRRDADNVIFPVLDNMHLSTSRHVAFTDTKPVLPPSSDFDNTYMVDIETIKSDAKRRPRKKQRGKKFRKARKNNKRRRLMHRHRHAKSRLRSKRSQYSSDVSSVCTTVSSWVAPSGEDTSLDQFEQPVTILPHIVVGERRIPQYIYETSCLEDNIPCKGIDKRHYRSECQTQKVFVYAYLRNSRGEETWGYVQINGYCNCKLHRKQRDGPRNILDYLHHLRSS